MAHDWRPEIVRLVQIKQAIAEADSNGIWEFHLPRVAAAPDSLQALEEILGFGLDRGYREFLGYADGWPSFFQSVDLFGVGELIGGPCMEAAHRVLSLLEPAALESAVPRGARLFPIAATTVDLDVFVMPVVEGVQRPPVIWLAGCEIDRFATFHDFVTAMIEYNIRELDALRGH